MASFDRRQARELADGSALPLLGLGVWQVPDGPPCVDAVRLALEAGYRHLDTAQAYGNEESVGKGLVESGLAREEVFVTTKFFPGATDPVRELEQSLGRIGVDAVDLYLVHWPKGGATWAWPRMEEAKRLGLTRSIGVSNFGVSELDEVLAIASDPPVVDQIRFSPFDYRRSLLDAATARDVAIEAYSTLGTGEYLSDPVVRHVAERLGRTPAQVLLRWCLERGVPVIPKSTHRQRITENAAIFDFALDDGDLAQLDALDRTGGTGDALERHWW